MAKSNMAGDGQYENQSKFLSFLSIVMSTISYTTEIDTASTISILFSSFGIILSAKVAEFSMVESNMVVHCHDENGFL